jgi:hypothetical protein
MAAILTTMGQVAGVGGLGLGVLLLVFKDFLRQKIFSTVGPAQTYKLMRQLLWATWSVAIAGLLLWFLGAGGIEMTFGPNSWIVNQ